MDDYIDKILMEDERIIRRIPFGKEHLPLLLINLTIFFFYLWLIHLLINLWHPMAGKLFLLWTGIFIVKGAWQDLQQEDVLTDRRILKKDQTGLFSFEVKEFFLHRVENIKFTQGVWGKIFNLGKFEISGSGNRIIVGGVPNPTEFRRLLDGAIVAAKERERRIGRRSGRQQRRRGGDEDDMEEKIIRIRGIR